MTPIAVVLDDLALSLRLRDELRARGVHCVLAVERDPVAKDEIVAACVALAAAGISAVVATDPASAPALVAALPRALPALLSVDATLDALEAREWLPPQDVYTEEELRRVTARLQDLGYA